MVGAYGPERGRLVPMTRHKLALQGDLGPADGSAANWGFDDERALSFADSVAAARSVRSSGAPKDRFRCDRRPTKERTT